MMWESESEDDDVGIHFEPTDEELIKEYLIPKNGREYILYKDVYAKEPWLLDHNNKDNFFNQNEWYYFSKRTQVSELKTGCGKNVKRKITGGGDGYWKNGNHVKIIEEKTGKTIGRKQTLTFIKSKNKNNKKQKIGDNNNTTSCVPGSDSSWIMEEYLLPEVIKLDENTTTTLFQELVICKIKEKKKNKSKMGDATCGLLQAGDGNMVHQSNDQFEQEQIVEDDPLSQDSYLPIQEEAAHRRWIQDQAFDYNSSANICI